MVGDVIGNYHPHGDGAAYSAMVNMANSPEPTVWGEGNWGGPTDPPAAYRYTEAKLTEYAHTYLVDPIYLAVSDMLPNFDGTAKEPLILPAKLPNLLLNGAQGIAVAVTTQIPAFERKGIVKLVEKALDGKKVTPEMCLKYLRFTAPFGSIGELVSTDKEVKRFFKHGQESLAFRPDRETDTKAGTYTVLSQTPGLNVGNINSTFITMDEVASVADLSSGEERIKIVITLKPSERANAKEHFAKYDQRLTRKVAYKLNVTERHLGKDGEHEVEFRTSTIPQILMDWVAWRIDLEVLVLKYLRDQVKEQIARQDLILIAIKNLDALIKTIRRKHKSREALITAVAKLLKVTTDQAQTVLAMSLNTLSNLSEAETKKKRAQLQEELAALKKDLKNPSRRIKTQL